MCHDSLKDGLETLSGLIKMRIAKVIARTAGALLVAFILCAALARAQTLSPEEKRISSYVDAHSQEAVQLLERVVGVESATGRSVPRCVAR